MDNIDSMAFIIAERLLKGQDGLQLPRKDSLVLLDLVEMTRQMLLYRQLSGSIYQQPAREIPDNTEQTSERRFPGYFDE